MTRCDQIAKWLKYLDLTMTMYKYRYKLMQVLKTPCPPQVNEQMSVLLSFQKKKKRKRILLQLYLLVPYIPYEA